MSHVSSLLWSMQQRISSFLCGIRMVSNRQRICWICMWVQCSFDRWPQIAQRSLKVEETLTLTTGPSEQQLEEGVNWALKHVASGQKIMVHCAHGHGRSAALLCAILLATGEASSVGHAEQILKAVRPRVRLNPRQKAALASWWHLKKRRQWPILIKNMIRKKLFGTLKLLFLLHIYITNLHGSQI